MNGNLSGEWLFKRNYPELDLLRSAAIALVMLVHFTRRVYALPADSWLGHFASWGWNGVELFFVLSGFLIGGQIIEEVQQGAFSFRRFYIKRFFRIFPPYYFSLAVVSALFFAGLADSNVVPRGITAQKFLTDISCHIFYLQDYISLHLVQGSLYWSLAVEEQFYMLIPVLLFFLLRYANGSFLTVISVLIFAAMLTRFAHYGNLLPFIPGSSASWSLGIRFPFHTRFDSLLSGVLAAWFFIRYHHALQRIKASLRALFYLCALAAIGLCVAYGNDSDGYFNTCWQFTLTNFGFSALILLLVTGSLGKHIRGSVWSFFKIIARYSYTMYLYHLMLLFPAAWLLSSTGLMRSDSPVKFLVYFGFYFFSVVIFSGLVYRFIDAPSMRCRVKILSEMER